jgi:hypothetical protein
LTRFKCVARQSEVPAANVRENSVRGHARGDGTRLIGNEFRDAFTPRAGSSGGRIRTL